MKRRRGIKMLTRNCLEIIRTISKKNCKKPINPIKSQKNALEKKGALISARLICLECDAGNS